MAARYADAANIVAQGQSFYTGLLPGSYENTGGVLKGNVYGKGSGGSANVTADRTGSEAAALSIGDYKAKAGPTPAISLKPVKNLVTLTVSLTLLGEVLLIEVLLIEVLTTAGQRRYQIPVDGVAVRQVDRAWVLSSPVPLPNTKARTHLGRTQWVLGRRHSIGQYREWPQHEHILASPEYRRLLHSSLFRSPVCLIAQIVPSNSDRM